MTYTVEQILTAIHANDEGLARYLLSTLDVETLREHALTFAKRVPEPIHANLEAEDATAWAMDQALTRAARLFGTTPSAILSTDRHREVLEARQVVCYVGRQLGMRYTVLGRRVNRDHSTVMSAVVRVGETPRLRRIANGIAGELGWDRTTEAAS